MVPKTPRHIELTLFNNSIPGYCSSFSTKPFSRPSHGILNFVKLTGDSTGLCAKQLEAQDLVVQCASFDFGLRKHFTQHFLTSFEAMMFAYLHGQVSHDLYTQSSASHFSLDSPYSESQYVKLSRNLGDTTQKNHPQRRRIFGYREQVLQTSNDRLCARFR